MLRRHLSGAVNKSPWGIGKDGGKSTTVRKVKQVTRRD